MHHSVQSSHFEKVLSKPNLTANILLLFCAWPQNKHGQLHSHSALAVLQRTAGWDRMRVCVCKAVGVAYVLYIFKNTLELFYSFVWLHAFFRCFLFLQNWCKHLVSSGVPSAVTS